MDSSASLAGGDFGVVAEGEGTLASSIRPLPFHTTRTRLRGARQFGYATGERSLLPALFILFSAHQQTS